MRIPEPLLHALLDRHPVARLATRNGTSGISQVPIVFVHHAGCLWSPVDGKAKSGRELQRLQNIRANPHVSLLLDHYEDDWSSLWWIRVDGLAEVLHADPNKDPQLATVVRMLRRKYPQYRHTPVLAGPPTLIKIQPERLVSWCSRAMDFI